MFVSDNSLESVLKYFQEKLRGTFTDRESRMIAKSVITQRLNLDGTLIFPPRNMTVSESDLLHFRSVIKRLQAGEPAQYVVGSTFFYNIELMCDERALIPRPETEELVDWIVRDAYFKDHLSILDIGTGSGCIALSLKKEFPEARVEAVDFSEDALNLARENAELNDLMVKFSQQDARNSEMITASKTYTIIVSNPPYIPEVDKLKMANHVVDYEPNLALFVSNDDPLIFYRQIAMFALKKLDLNGALYFELNEDLAQETVELLKGLGFNSVELREDLQGKLRMLKATRNNE
jgi:release factor glutamine methyltransferase